MGYKDSPSILSVNAGEILNQRVANYADITLPADMWIRWKANDASVQYAIFGLQDAGTTNRITFFNDGTANEIAFQTGKADSYTSTYYLNKDIANWHTWRMSWESGEAKIWWLEAGETSRGWKLVGTHTDPSQYVPIVDMLMRLVVTNAGNQSVDWIFVRPWSSPEPLVIPSALGEEILRRILITHV